MQEVNNWDSARDGKAHRSGTASQCGSKPRKKIREFIDAFFTRETTVTNICVFFHYGFGPTLWRAAAPPPRAQEN